jgi:hypothetical protein
MLRELIRDTSGGIDDALGLIFQILVLVLVFAFSGVLIGSAVVQSFTDIVAHHVASLEVSTPPSFTVAQATNEASTYLLANNPSEPSSVSQCSTTASTCIVFEPCSATSPACVVVVERKVTLPVIGDKITWIAKATSVWQPGTVAVN